MPDWWRGRIGKLPVLEVRPVDVAEELRAIDNGKSLSGREMSVATHNHHLTCLSAMFTWAAKERVYGFDANPLLGAHLRRREPRGRIRGTGRGIGP